MKGRRSLGLVLVFALILGFAADRLLAAPKPCCEYCDDPYACEDVCGGDPVCYQNCYQSAMTCWLTPLI